MSRRSFVVAFTTAALCMSAPSLAQDARDDDAGYRAATGLLHRDLPEQAAAQYRAFLKGHPDHALAASARYGLAVCLTRLGQWKEAGAELDALKPGKDFDFAADAVLLRGIG